MSLDPQRLTQSSGLHQAKEKGQRMAKSVARRIAREHLRRTLKKQLMKKTAKGFLKTAGKRLLMAGAKAIKVLLTKVIATVFGAVISLFGTIGIPIIAIVVAIIVATFLIHDFNFDLKGDMKTIWPIYEQASMKTIDASKPEQVEWKVPTGLIASIVQILETRSSATTGNAVAGGDGDITAKPIFDGTHPPAQFIPIYKAAQAKYGTPWYLLAAIHRAETSFSTDPHMVSPTGAIGPMQFEPATWAGWKYAIDGGGRVSSSLDITNLNVIREGDGEGVDGDGDGRADPWNIYDAVFSTASYLAKNGAATNVNHAIHVYNHDTAYVDQVLGFAAAYKSEDTSSASSSAPVSTPPPAAVTPTPPPVSVSTSALSTETYEQLADMATSGIKPNFTYSPFELKTWQYEYHWSCGQKGCTYWEEPPKPGRVVAKHTESRITAVDTWRGIYQIEWQIVGNWVAKERHELDDNSGYILYEKQEKLQEKDRIYSPNFNRLLSEFSTLGMQKHEIEIFDLLYNSQVDPKSPEYTNREPIQLSALNNEGISGVGMTGSPPPDLPPDQLKGEFIWPVPSINRISSGFGPRAGGFHKGIDIAIGGGQSGGHAIYAAADGVVLVAGPRDPNGFGQAIYISHGNGIYTRYGHTQWNAYGVKPGDHVKKGQYIGEIGSGKVGSADAPHCHFEIIVHGSNTEDGSITGEWVNPIYYVHPPS
jgi:murein DD-endopeptidase MepM/ murein hydrolase activator NlpD